MPYLQTPASPVRSLLIARTGYGSIRLEPTPSLLAAMLFYLSIGITSRFARIGSSGVNGGLSSPPKAWMMCRLTDLCKNCAAAWSALRGAGSRVHPSVGT
jgi:hypothetical protein